MSDREFENYLALLSSLLRLDSKQRISISDELRAHLEDRLEELLARGVSHDDAVRQALAEFGDAAGLAGQFVAISMNRKRRWLMRLTTFSVAATLLFAAGLAIFWPGRNAAPGLAEAVAQAPAAAKKVDPFSASGVEPTLQEKLNKRIDLVVVELPLKGVIAHLQEETGIQFVLSMKKLDEASVSPDTPITKTLRRVRAGTLLDLVLKDLELDYIERDDLLIITTPEDAESQMLIRVYDCRDLLTMSSPSAVFGNRPATPTIPPPPTAAPGTTPVQPAPGGVVDPFGAAGGAVEPFAPARGAPAATASSRRASQTPDSEVERRARELTTLVTTIVDPDTWSGSGGPGSVYSYSGLVVVAQTEHTHKKVERLFDMLREAAGLEAPKSGKVVR
jgi:hypothetical protein